MSATRRMGGGWVKERYFDLQYIHKEFDSLKKWKTNGAKYVKVTKFEQHIAKGGYMLFDEEKKIATIIYLRTIFLFLLKPTRKTTSMPCLLSGEILLIRVLIAAKEETSLFECKSFTTRLSSAKIIVWPKTGGFYVL